MQIKTTSAQVHETFDGTFECRACGFEAPAMVRASGKGAAVGHGRGSSATAYENAQEDAGDVASWTLAFLPCPHCGVTDRLSRSYRIQSIGIAIVVGLVIAGALYAIIRAKLPEYADKSGYEPISLVFGGIVTLALYLWKRRAWANVRSRVAVDMNRARITAPD